MGRRKLDPEATEPGLVDLSPSQAKRFLRSCESRVAIREGLQFAQVLHAGEWLTLCRTDLKDDVKTHGRVEVDFELAGVVQRYANIAAYGARVDDSTFAVIDAFSDG